MPASGSIDLEPGLGFRVDRFEQERYRITMDPEVKNVIWAHLVPQCGGWIEYPNCEYPFFALHRDTYEIDGYTHKEAHLAEINSKAGRRFYLNGTQLMRLRAESTETVRENHRNIVNARQILLQDNDIVVPDHIKVIWSGRIPMGHANVNHLINKGKMTAFFARGFEFNANSYTIGLDALRGAMNDINALAS